MFALLKLRQNFFSAEPNSLLIPKVGPSSSTKNYSCNCQHDMMNYNQDENF